MYDKIAFLLGSGASIPSGIPSMQTITQRVLSGEGFRKHTSGIYEIAEKPLAGHEAAVPRVCKFIKLIADDIDKYYYYSPSWKNELEYQKFFGKHSTNYEDIFYVVTQLWDSESGEHENPIVTPYMLQLKKLAEQEGLCCENPTYFSWTFVRLIRETQDYIWCIVWQLLNTASPGRQCNNVLASILERVKFECPVDIYTLNHDTSLENTLETRNIPYSAGFGEEIEGIRYWCPDDFERKDIRFHIYKLHGSIDWFQFQSSVGIPINGDYEHAKDVEGNPMRADPPKPLILIGTFNKMLMYTSGIFADLYSWFAVNLKRINRLIVIGYGFGDKGINSRILDWVGDNHGHKLVIIDPEAEKLKRTGRGAFRKNWEKLQEIGKLTFIKKGVEELTDADVQDILF